MIFKHVNKTVEPLSLKIENTNIERVTNFNFLGLTISDNSKKLPINVQEQLEY